VGPDEPAGRRCYLDAYWDRWKVIAEIEGIHHEWETNQISDTMRQNELTLTDVVLRIPVVGLRDCPAPYLDQLRALLRRRGWPG
jgi:very-short-patch-repair endonuclease